MAWADAQPANSLFLSTPVLAELRFGVERLGATARAGRLKGHVDRLEDDLYRNRILNFDVRAAGEFGRLVARREKLGRRIEPMDAMIAAIAAAHGAALATRDGSDFADLGLNIIDPFATAASSR
jgi:predicted nucleic acid-binding protein